jgi:hypothetical protein
MTAYEKVVWVDEVPSETPVKYEIVDDVEGTIASSASIDLITELTVAGTALTAINLNHMDDGIFNAQDAADAAQDTADAAAIACAEADYLYALRDFPIDVPLNGPEPLTTNDKGYARIPAKLNGGSLVAIAAMCVGASSSGAITLNVKKSTGGGAYTTMLSTNITIDEGETDTLTAGVPGTIGASNTVATGDHIEVSVVDAGTGVTYCLAELVFRPAAA